MFGFKNFWSTEVVSPKKILGQKKILGKKKILGLKNFGLEICWSNKIAGPKIFALTKIWA